MSVKQEVQDYVIKLENLDPLDNPIMRGHYAYLFLRCFEQLQDELENGTKPLGVTTEPGLDEVVQRYDNNEISRNEAMFQVATMYEEAADFLRSKGYDVTRMYEWLDTVQKESDSSSEQPDYFDELTDVNVPMVKAEFFLRKARSNDAWRGLTRGCKYAVGLIGLVGLSYNLVTDDQKSLIEVATVTPLGLAVCYLAERVFAKEARNLNEMADGILNPVNE